MPPRESVLQALDSVIGPINISYILKASAPYSLTISSGLITLPKDLDIFWPSGPKIKPWLINLAKGSLVGTTC
ncbi:Uncharacterised protein [Chlamydia abortus]|nr:Uncharacterised protein [Chlamydia abortus]SGA31000.1 Uncharacterised protein [Chlamydia abortus]